jgi:hypothetical protein
MASTKEVRPMISITNAETGEEIVRPMNDEEYSNHLEMKADAEKYEANKVAIQKEKTALLARLGLTEDELKTILG